MEILASQLQADLKAIAQARIREKGLMTISLSITVYSGYQPSGTWGVNNWKSGITETLVRTVDYDFRNIVIDNIPTPIAVVKGELITPDSVFRMKNWVIGNVILKFKGILSQTKLIDARTMTAY